jgi:Gpi18-like mannosyltransferase
VWTDVRAATAWGLAWLILVTLGFMLAQRARFTRLRLQHLRLPYILLIAGLVRLLPAIWLPVGAGYDIESFRLVTDALLRGDEVYTSVLGRHPYLPFQMYLMGAMAYMAQVTGLPYVFAIKLPAVLADIALTALIYQAVIDGGKPHEAAGFFALLYALNPVSLLVTSYHGQFESVTLLLLVLAWFFWHFGRRRRRSGIALGFAILNKTWPVVFLPVILIRLREWRERLGYTLLAIGIPVLFMVAYLLIFSADPQPMLRRALTHRGVAGYWGPGAFLVLAAIQLPDLQSVVDSLIGLKNALLLLAVGFALWQTRRQPALDALLTLLLCLFVVTVGFGIQWLVWLVPFGILVMADRWIKWYSLAATFMLAVHLYGLHLYPWLGEWLSRTSVDWLVRLSALPAWLIVLAWTISRLRQISVEQMVVQRASEPG